MKCEVVKFHDGTTVFVCGRARRKAKPCACGKISTKLCDFPVRGARNKTTCDAPLCDDCAVRIGEDRDLCPMHAKFWRGQA